MWADINLSKPKVGQDCIVLGDDGKVNRALYDPLWMNGFCVGDRKHGISISGNAIFWMPFISPTKKKLKIGG